jgi:hypothetical protein
MTTLSNFSGMPRGNHCNRFDTDLVEQIIEVEIEVATHRLQEAKGLVIDSATQHRWKDELREVLVHTFLEEATMHTVLPAEIQGCLSQTLDTVIEVDCAASEGVNTEIVP